MGQALVYKLEEILHLAAEIIARAGEGDEASLRACDQQRFCDAKYTSSEQRPSMAHDRRAVSPKLNSSMASSSMRVERWE